jgi:hypothetical protein
MPMFKSFTNKLFTKFVIYAFLPAIVMFFTKIVSMLLLSTFYDVRFEKTSSGFMFYDINQFLFVNNLSNIITYITMAGFTVWLLIKAYYFHQSHVSPKFSAWLNVQNLEHLLIGSVELYLKMVAWLFFLWMTTIIMFVHAVIGIAAINYSYVAFVSSTFLTVMFIVDIERDQSILRELKKLNI